VRLSCALVAAEDHHVEVAVWSRLVSEKEIDRPAARDPPRNRQTGEQGSRFFGAKGIPSLVF
jgi:hypothetical protein